MAGYTRQSVAEIIAGAVVKAAPINAEYNAIRDAFVHATGHKHDGTPGEGAFVPLISDPDNYNKVVLDENNNTIIFSVQVNDAGVAQVRIQDGVFFPIADNDIDLGTAANEFKDLYLDGTAKIDTLTVDENATVAGTLGVTGATTLSDNLSVGGTADVTGATTLGGTLGVTGATTLSSTLGVSGATTLSSTLGVTGATTLGSTLGVTGATTLSSTLAVTGTITASGGVTGNLTGNVTGNLTGNVTANSGTSTFNNITVAGTANISGFQDYYLGPSATEPTQDLDGSPLEEGDLYFDTTDNQLYVYDGSNWLVAAINENAVLQVANNLSDLNNADTALTNLGLTATATEINHLSGVTSNVQTQFDNINVTVGTLTKTFASGEQASITLSSAISPAPVVSVTKEVAQTGITSKGGWDVATDGSNYELHDTAYDTTLTPGTVISDASAWSYDSKTFSVSSQETTPQGLAFNTDGTKMFVVGRTTDSVYQYTLSTSFDVSTASYDSVSFSVASEDTNPFDITFNNDGTKMYINGLTNDAVFQYTLSTAYDLSTASYDSVSFSVASEDTDPVGLSFNNDGTKMYLAGGANDTVYQYSLSTAFDISTASYDSVSFSVASEETGTQAIVFNSNGTKMYIMGSTGDDVNQYTLSTAFDISTASFDSVTFSVASQDATVSGMVFSSDYTKMYVVGTTTDTIYQYSVGSEALILGSGSFASTDVGKRIVGNGGEAILTATDGSYSEVTAFNDSSAIASGDWSMFALTFDGTDGVKIGGIANGFDIANASYDSVSLDVSSEDTEPSEISFNADGTKMYILGGTGDDINQYTLSTAFDISTASFDSVTFDVSSEESNPRGLVFNNDGTKMYVVGFDGDDVNQYSLSTAFDLSTASFDSVTFSVSAQDTVPVAIIFNDDGTKMYIAGQSNDAVYQYSLSSAFDVSTSVYDNVSLSVISEQGAVRGIRFNNNGTKIFVSGSTEDTISQYSLSTAYDISTASYDSVSFDFSGQETSLYGFNFNNDGTKMYVVGIGTDTVYQYSTGSIFTPTSQYHPTVTKTSGQIDTSFWLDINTMTADETLNGGEVYYAVSTDDRTTWAVIDDTDGVRPIVRDNAGTWQYNDASTYGGTTWVNATTNEELYALQEALEDGVAEEAIGFQDASTWSYDSVSFSIASQETSPEAVIFNSDGTKMYIVGRGTDSVYQYTLSTAFDVSTASYDSVSFSVASQDTTPTGIVFNNDGTKLYVVGDGNNSIFQYSLSTAYDLSTTSYDSVSFSVASQETFPEGIEFNNDGTKMYIVGRDSDAVYQYTLSTSFDLSTASYDSVSLSVASEDTTPNGLSFNSNGTKLYVVGSTNDNVYQYSLSTAYDLSTASYDSVSFNVATQEDNPKGLTFNSDGTKMYVVGYTNDTIYQYSTGTTGNFNRMNSTQLDAVTDPNHYTLGDTLDLAIMLYTDSAGSIPESDGVSINYDAEALNQGAVLGTDYDFDFPDSTTVRITSNAAQNLKIRVV